MSSSTEAMADSDIHCKLQLEVSRIILSPYPVSLRTLKDILSLDRDKSALDFLSSQEPCKLRSLAASIIDTLEYRPLEADLIATLCENDIFRIALVELRPELLQTLLAKSLAGHEPYTRLCFEIFRQPLPEAVCLPQAAEDFFIAAVNDGVRNPSRESLSKLYDLISGACHDLPQVIPQVYWVQFEVKIIKTLRRCSTILDQTVSLLCLGILDCLVRRSAGSSGRDLVNSSAFFIGDKASRSLDLAAIQCSWLAKPENYSTKVDLARNLDIVLHIFEAVKSDAIKSWIQTIDGHNNFARLVSRLNDQSIGKTTLAQLLAICAVIHRASPLPKNVLSRVESLLEDEAFLEIDRSCFNRVMGVVLHILSSDLSVEPWAALMAHLTKSATCASSTAPLRMANCVSLAKLLQSIVEIKQPLAERISSILENVADAELQVLVHIEARPPHQHFQDRCRYAQYNTRAELLTGYRNLWLTATLRSNSKPSARLIQNSVSIVKSLQYGPSMGKPCEQMHAQERKAFVLIEQQSTQENRPYHTWKDKLRAFTEQEAAWRERQLVQVVSGICADLEERCSLAEQPQRDHDATLSEMQRDMAQLRQAKAELERQVVDLNIQLSSAESGQAELEESLQSDNNDLQHKNDQLEEKLRSIEDQLAKSERTAKARLDQAKEEFQAKEFELRASIVEGNAQIEILSAEAATSTAVLHNTEGTLRQAQEDLASLVHKCDILQGDRDQQQNQLEDEVLLKGELELELRTLHTKYHDMGHLLTLSKDEFESLHRQLLSTNQEAEQAIASLKANLDDQAVTHEHEVENIKLRAAAEKNAVDVHLEKITVQFKGQQEKIQQLVEQREETFAKTTEQRKQIDGLRKALLARDEEIADFQAMRQTLAAAIGHRPAKRHVSKAVHYTPSIQQSPAARRHSRRLTEQVEDPPLALDANHGPTVMESFASLSSQEGPTPKRAKPRKPFKVPIVRQRHSVAVTPKSAHKTPRLPLTDMSTTKGNISPLRQTLSLRKKHPEVHGSVVKAKSHAQEWIQDFEFGSEVFTSTPFAGTLQGVNDDDDMTVDE